MYKYELSEVKIMEWFCNGSTTDTVAIFEVVPHYTEFQFRVRARTTVGYGPFSVNIPGKTLPSGIWSFRKKIINLNA